MKCGKKQCQEVLLCTDLVTPRQSQGQWNWYQMVQVIGAYKRGGYGKIWLNSSGVMSNVLAGGSDDHDSLQRKP